MNWFVEDNEFKKELIPHNGNKYLTGNFGKFKRKYKLEHPRTTKKAN